MDSCEGRKKIGFGRSTDLKLYEEKSWVLSEVQIWILMKMEEKRWDLAEVQIWHKHTKTNFGPLVNRLRDSQQQFDLQTRNLDNVDLYRVKLVSLCRSSTTFYETPFLKNLCINAPMPA